MILFPEQLQYVAEGKKTCRLLGGTFTMEAEEIRTLFRGSSVQRSFSEFKIRFRWMEDGVAKGDFDLNTGTMNPSQLTQGNQIVLLVVDIAPSENIAGEFVRFAMKEADNQTIVIAMWAPDGAEGRSMIEREPFFIDPWVQNKRGNIQFFKLIGAIVAGAILAGLLSLFVPCLIFLLPIPVAFFFKKNAKRIRGNQLSYPEYFSVMETWINNLVADGTMQKVSSAALGVAQEVGRL